MKNPFKIYTPVRELIEDIKENPHKYVILFDYDDVATAFLVEDRAWSISASPGPFGFIWTNDNFKWSTWAERRYFYLNIKALCKAKTPEHKTREGWIKKLGVKNATDK